MYPKGRCQIEEKGDLKILNTGGAQIGLCHLVICGLVQPSNKEKGGRIPAERHKQVSRRTATLFCGGHGGGDGGVPG